EVADDVEQLPRLDVLAQDCHADPPLSTHRPEPSLASSLWQVRPGSRKTATLSHPARRAVDLVACVRVDSRVHRVAARGKRADADPIGDGEGLHPGHPGLSRPSVIEVLHLHKAYRETVAVEDLSFPVGPGQILGLLGPNGAGKTTTMRAVA